MNKQTNKQTSPLVFTARLRQQFRMSPVRRSVVRIRGMMRVQHFWIRTSVSSTATACWHAASTAAACYDWREVAGMANFKMYLLCQFCNCSNRVGIFFTIHRRHRRKKRWTRIWKFEISNSVIFENFFKFSQKASRGPSAADLDHYGRGQTRLQ